MLCGHGKLARGIGGGEVSHYDRMTYLAILILFTAFCVGFFFDVPRYVPALILLLAIYPIREISK